MKERFLAACAQTAAERAGAARGAGPRRASGRGGRDGEVRLTDAEAPALRPGDRIAVVAPASPFARHEFDAGIAEIRALGFEPVFEESVFERTGYVAGPAATRARRAFNVPGTIPSIAALVAVRGGYGSVQMLPLLDPATSAGTRRPSSATATTRPCSRG